MVQDTNRRGSFVVLSARTMWRDQHVRQFMEGLPRWSAVRLGLGWVLPPDIERGASEMTAFQRGILRILVDDRPRDVIRSAPRIPYAVGFPPIGCARPGEKSTSVMPRDRRLNAIRQSYKLDRRNR
jgi:hypothetical protein